ncbi:MAG: hypothetical protein JNM31_13500 [Flavobacteriales bacterium]|nr:hypothetical protein [Flavobacteriales bacterium]
MRTLLTCLSICMFTMPILAQDDDGPLIPEEKLQEIKAQKAAFLTSQMDLTPEEAQRFWPVYNKYDKELDGIRTEQRELMKEVRDKDRAGNLSDADATRLMDRDLALRQRELDLRQRYTAEFRKVIGPVKTLRLGKAERDFNRELLRRARERAGSPRGDGPPPPRR